MPIIAIVDGIHIVIFPNDHAPPQFHAFLAEHMIKVDIEKAAVIGRRGPAAMERKILDWTKLHRPELLEAWMAIRSSRKPRRIE